MTASLAPAASQSRTPTRLGVLLMVLTVFGPISMDLSLPALPALTDELGAATSMAQLTVTACLLGLAGGQLIAGPLSDRFGRRGPLLIGVVAYVIVSILCAASPTVELLILARLVQGLAGGVGIVIAQAAGRDLYEGGALIRFYGRLTVIGCAILCWVAAPFGETLAPDDHPAGGFGRIAADMRVLLSDRAFVGALLVRGFVNAALSPT